MQMINIFLPLSTFKVSSDNKQRTDPDNTALEAFLLRLSSSLFCVSYSPWTWHESLEIGELARG